MTGDNQRGQKKGADLPELALVNPEQRERIETLMQQVDIRDLRERIDQALQNPYFANLVRVLLDNCDEYPSITNKATSYIREEMSRIDREREQIISMQKRARKNRIEKQIKICEFWQKLSEIGISKKNFSTVEVFTKPKCLGLSEEQIACLEPVQLSEDLIGLIESREIGLYHTYQFAEFPGDYVEQVKRNVLWLKSPRPRGRLIAMIFDYEDNGQIVDLLFVDVSTSYEDANVQEIKDEIVQPKKPLGPFEYNTPLDELNPDYLDLDDILCVNTQKGSYYSLQVKHVLASEEGTILEVVDGSNREFIGLQDCLKPHSNIRSGEILKIGDFQISPVKYFEVRKGKDATRQVEKE